MLHERIVLKIGTNVLTDEDGNLDQAVIKHLVAEIATLKSKGIEVVLVSSGAVGAGRATLTLPKKLNQVTKRQVYSAIGQIRLLGYYQEAFANYDIFCAQVLATKEDFRDRKHFINMKRCLSALMRDDIVPIINENDVISITELMFTDNDELAGLTASLINAEALIILSSVDGVLARDGTVIRSSHARDEAILEHITTSKSSFGRGGMFTKVRICQQAAMLGIHAYIANGKQCRLVDLIRQDAACTYFRPQKAHSGIKKWMAFNEDGAQAKVFINNGALEILKDSARVASLLPVGIITFQGDFKKGDLINIHHEERGKVGIGIAAYGSKKLKPLIGERGGKAFIHYDYLLVN